MEKSEVKVSSASRDEILPQELLINSRYVIMFHCSHDAEIPDRAFPHQLFLTITINQLIPRTLKKTLKLQSLSH